MSRRPATGAAVPPSTPRSLVVGIVALALAAAAGCSRSPARGAAAVIERLGGRATLAPAAGAAPETLRKVDLAHTRVADADVARLAREWGGAEGPLAAVEELDLTHTGVGDEAVAAVAAFPALRKLSLTLTRVTDRGLAPLAGLDRLAELYLAETAVSDAAVPVLERMASLRTLVLLRTAVSDAGAAALRRALPQALVQTGMRPRPAAPAAASAGKGPP
jgi:hypothetical protein